jgi:citronellol/citronellal dehydrogenase
VAKAVEEAGGKTLAIKLNIRDEDSVAAVMAQAAGSFGAIDATKPLLKDLFLD